MPPDASTTTAGVQGGEVVVAGHDASSTTPEPPEELLDHLPGNDEPATERHGAQLACARIGRPSRERHRVVGGILEGEPLLAPNAMGITCSVVVLDVSVQLCAPEGPDATAGLS